MLELSKIWTCQVRKYCDACIVSVKNEKGIQWYSICLAVYPFVAALTT